MRPWIRTAWLATAILALAAPLAAAGDAGETVGSDTCAACHEDVAAGFRLTGHARASGWDAETGCESCHGPGGAHVAADGDPDKIARLGAMEPADVSKTCLGCHDRQASSWKFGGTLHALADVGCVDCHDVHGTAEHQLRARPVELCTTCHASIAATFDLPRSHPMDPAGDGCVTCHDPHGSSSPRMLTSFGSDTCTECHIDKRGPFVYGHDAGLVDGCDSCHQVHGSTNRHLLDHDRQVNLCYSCHAGTTTPTFHSFARFEAEKCTACHTAIHGSNTNPYFLEE